MNHIVLPDKPSHGLPFYLAAEEFAAMDRNAGEAFFVWSVPPTVIFGRNQDIFTEVSLDYCRAHGVDVVRRKSGGGCVYADKGNIMISYITRRGDVEDVFGRYLDRMTEALAGLGVHAERSGRNDILVDGFKVSGNAFRMLPDRCVVHGTLLYDVDFDAMAAAISPSSGKLASNGVASVRARVANLKPFLDACGHADMGVDALKAYLVDFFCDTASEVTEEDVKEIEKIESTYREPSFFYGKAYADRFRYAEVYADRSDVMGNNGAWIMSPCEGYCFRCGGRVPGVGEVRMALFLDDDGKIADVRLSGDYFLLDGMTPETVDKAFAGVLAGAGPEDMPERLKKMDPGSMILNLSQDDLCAVLRCGLPDAGAGST